MKKTDTSVESLYESCNTAIPISNLVTSLNDEGIRPTTIFIGNVIAERGSGIGDISELRQEFVLRFLRRYDVLTSTVTGHSTKESHAKAEKALSRFRRARTARTFRDID